MNQDLFKKLESTPLNHVQSLESVVEKLKFNEAGLIPVIAQQFDSKEVLMMAWMNRQALKTTLTEGQVCYWSRSRQSYWRKGESSGHVQRLRELRIDCDGDALLALVDQQGPACHTNRRSCFYLLIEQGQVRVITEPVGN